MPTITRAEVDEAFLRLFEVHVHDPGGTVAAVREEAERRILEAEALAE